MSAAAQLDLIYATMLQLLADPRGAYAVDTDTLQCIAARIPAMQHSRRPGDPVFDASEAMRVQIVATLACRAYIDRAYADHQRATTDTVPPTSAPSSPSGGARVPVPTPPRTPAPAGYAQPDGAL